jgi:hypothetical protein
MESTPDNLPERLMHFHRLSKDMPSALVAAPIVEAAEHIATLRKTLHAIVEMIDDCPDAPRGSDSLSGAIRFYADGALRGIDTGVK